jgi:hypothetical protein
VILIFNFASGMKKIGKILFSLSFLSFLFFATTALTSCGASKGEGQASEQQGKKKKLKKCKIKSCHVRMVHAHEGSDFKGKGSWFLKRCFYFGKNPKYGEGLKREGKRDPHQGKRN